MPDSLKNVPKISIEPMAIIPTTNVANRLKSVATLSGNAPHFIICDVNIFRPIQSKSIREKKCLRHTISTRFNISAKHDIIFLFLGQTNSGKTVKPSDLVTSTPAAGFDKTYILNAENHRLYI